MAFEATTPFAIACLMDASKSAQSLAVLKGDRPVEWRAKQMTELASNWNIAMSVTEAYQIVTEYDRVVQAANGKLEPLAYS